MTQIGDQCCRKDLGFPDYVSFTFSISILFIPWKSVGFNNSRSTHDCHKRPVPIVKFVSFMIVTSVMYPPLGKTQIFAQFHSIYDWQKQPVSVEKSSNFTHFDSAMIVTRSLYPSENIGFSTIPFHLRLLRKLTACVCGKILYYLHLVRLSGLSEARVHQKTTGYCTLWLYYYWYFDRRSCSLRSWEAKIIMIIK